MKAGIDIESPAGVERGASELRLSLRRVVVGWLFGAVWMFITTGAAMTQFGKLVGMSPFGFGVLAALPFFGALAQLPTSLVIERWGNRRSVFLVTCVVHRMLALAIGLGPHGIRMNCVAPGFTDTEASRGIADVTKYDTSKTPLGRVVKPEDLTGAALFLASPESDFIRTDNFGGWRKGNALKKGAWRTVQGARGTNPFPTLGGLCRNHGEASFLSFRPKGEI